jgi:hypothetical protein
MKIKRLFDLGIYITINDKTINIPFFMCYKVL